MPNGIGGNPPSTPSTPFNLESPPTSSPMGSTPQMGGERRRRAVTPATESPSINPNQHTTEPTTGPPRLVTPRTTGSARFTLRLVATLTAAGFIARVSEPAVNTRSTLGSTSSSGNSNLASTHGNHDVTTTHPEDWTPQQQSSLQHAMDRAGGVDATSTTAATTQDYTQQGARPRTTQTRNPQTQARHNRKNTRWARNQERHRRNADETRNRRDTPPPHAEPENQQVDEVQKAPEGTTPPQNCGNSKDFDPQRAKIAAGKGTPNDYGQLGGFMQCRGEKYTEKAAQGGNANAAYRHAQTLLGQIGPEMQASQEALDAMAIARRLGHPQATVWVNRYIELQMRHARAYMTEGNFETNSGGGLYTEDSSSFLQQAARVGFGPAQANGVRLFANLNQLGHLWEMMSLLANNIEYLHSEMTADELATMRWIVKFLKDFAPTYVHGGLTDEQLLYIEKIFYQFARNNFNK